MLNKLFSLIGKSISPSGGGVVPACTQFVYNVGFPPYGTVIGTGTVNNELNWVYSDSTGGSGTFIYGVTGYQLIADGAGGNFITYVSYAETATYNQVIDDSEWHPDYRIIYKGSGTWSECHRAGGTGNMGSGSLYVNINGTDYQAGTYSYTEYYDGLCGVYQDQSNSWYPYGTSIFGDGTYNYFWDGNGGYYTENASPSYPSYGEFLYGDGGSSDLTWYAPDGSSGSWTYASWGCSYYADGMGGSYSNCGGYTQPYGTSITSGSYSYENGTDEWGNPTYGYGSYTIYFDGNSGYYTNTY